MTLYLDSAMRADAERCAELGFVHGATTNPSLIAAAGLPPAEVVTAFCELLPGTIFYQPSAETVAEREDEARRMVELAPGRVGLKIPCTPENLAMAAKLAGEDYLVGITAIFSAAQAYLACRTGARYVLPYVNRSTRLLGDGPALVRQMRSVIDADGADVEIVAASVKTPEEAVETVLAGAHHLTLPLGLIQAMGQHELSDAAIAAFGEAAAG